MRNRFERQLLELNNELIQMGSMIEHATTRRSMSRKRPWSRSA